MAVRLPQLDIVAQAVAALGTKGATSVEIVGPWGSAKPLVAVQTAQAVECPLLYITAGRIDAESAHEDLATFAGEDRCLLFPAWEVLPTDAMAPADDVVAERMNTLKNLAAALETGEARHVVAPVRSLLQYVIDRRRLVDRTVLLRVGEEHDFDDLLTKLIDLGYTRELMVEQRGEMSVRGGIFDVFPISSTLPYRIEFFGDEIESIRRFEPETQRSVERVSSIQIPPRSEKAALLAQADAPGLRCAVWDYFPPGSVVAMDEPMAIAEEALNVEAQCADARFFMSWQHALERLGAFRRLTLAQVAHQRAQGAVRVVASMESITGWSGNTGGFWDQLRRWDNDGYTVQLLCNNTGERQRLFELLEEQGYRLGRDAFDLRVDIGSLRAGFVSGKDRLAILSEREMFGRRYMRRVRRRFEAGAAITAFSDLKPGDYLVHVDHGIGRYLGLRRFPGKAGDFLAAQYAGGDMVYVPVTHIDLVQKYVAGEGDVPKVDKLGGATWARKKARVKKAVRDMTQELLQLYAARLARAGHAFSGDTHWQTEFEDAFEYEETPDQARAIVEVKRDMESPKPMDRLICGDVGFGKTEVALRAAFKAVMDGKQVAVLVPTTILALQHYSTFSERIADYPIRVEILSRFRSPKEQRDTVERLKSGEVDILIGTHRIISKDIQFKDLGLVVIDEEQRFGVAQKEKLKHLRTTVDLLTMTATPIPRTLHFSLMGARDMSIINTAPNDRLPTHTCIAHFDEDLIREALEREIRRQGQVFFLHNRVQTIIPVAEFVQKLVPTARVAIAHGQMHEHQLEDVMHAFINKEIDVLVCTTIIGSGLDIPNANTIIINRADQFGLAELYQLRGRVGRYKHRAFAYLLVPGDRALSEDAQKRLKAIEEYSVLGAGYLVAMRDLEIRGCGNILGAEQHGHIASVGYETYSDLIQEAVAELRGEPVKRRVLPPFDVALDAYIPEEYVLSEMQKITLYKRIAGLGSVEEVAEMHDELNDRFGRPPQPVRRLLDVMRVRAQAAEAGVKRLAATKDAITVEFVSERFVSRKVRSALGVQFGSRIRFAWQDVPSATLSLDPESADHPIQAAERLLHAFTETMGHA
jgi:transcription-repair coupling factor (superfamily II helicase)